MRLFLLIFLCFFNVTCSHDTIENRDTPIHKGVDKELRPYVNGYLRLAMRNHIVFSKKVTIGLRKIKRKNIIGTCYQESNFREVDIDSDYWKNASEISRFTLISHELTHCYCGRDHDYGKKKLYPIIKTDTPPEISEEILHKDKSAFFDDYCPITLMYPYLVSEGCIELHGNHYFKEMFDRCVPY